MYADKWGIPTDLTQRAMTIAGSWKALYGSKLLAERASSPWWGAVLYVFVTVPSSLLFQWCFCSVFLSFHIFYEATGSGSHQADPGLKAPPCFKL